MSNSKNIPQRLLLLILGIGVLHIAVSESAFCNPACRNGGSCLFNNICRCPTNFVGNQCQYSVDRCAPHKIGFNGGVRCVRTSTSMTCTLSCPQGINFDSPPEAAYTCTFETGVFTPAKVPKCVFGEGVEVIRKTVEAENFSEATCYPTCKNGGTCIFRNMCQCPKDFAGPQCQYSVDRCAPQKIGFNGGVRCVRTSTTMTCTLSCPQGINFDSPPETAYTCTFESGTFTPARVPQCVFGEGVEVFRRTVDSENFSEATCYPSCKNGGTCIFRDMCQCPKDFVGPQCQYSVDRCAMQKIGFNGAIRCSGSSTEMRCTLSCPPGVQFDTPPSGAYTCKYERGSYLPTKVPKCLYGEGVQVIQRTALGRASDDATCNPNCMNGGVCIFHNLCQCPTNFRGPQCQYSVDRCSIKRTGFNGGFRCTGKVAETSCTIYCPEGTDYEFAPASEYTCKYETGQFSPSIPKCVLGKDVELISVPN